MVLSRRFAARIAFGDLPAISRAIASAASRGDASSRVARPSATASSPDMSGTQTLRHLVRLDVAKELTFTGRIVSGEEAVALGLATRVEESPREAALAMARQIAGRSPNAIRAAKRLLNTTVASSQEEGFRLEESIQRSLIGSPNQLEAVQANLEKRAPRFVDPD